MNLKKDVPVVLSAICLIGLAGAASAQEMAAPTIETFEVQISPPGEAGMPPMAFGPVDEDIMFPVLGPGMHPPPPGMGRGGPGCGPDGCMFAGLDLTDDQYEKLFAVKKDAVSKLSGKMGSMAALHMDLQDALLQPEVDRAKAQAVQSRINALKADLADIKLDERINMLAVLTPEQRKEMRRNALKAATTPGGGRRGFRHHARMGGGGDCK